MYKFLVFICLLQAVYIVKAQDKDFLKPDESTFSEVDPEYKLKIRQKLLANLTELPNARVIVCPSFEPEYAISIESKKNKNGFGYDISKKYLILRTCNPSIWSSIQAKKDSVVVYNREILIDSLFAQTVETLFKKALSKARFPLKPTTGLDGTGYYFISTIMFGGIHCGYTWSPDSATKMSELCQIAELLRDYCETNDIRIKNEIITKSNNLIQRFEDKPIENTVSYERYLWISLTSVLTILIVILIVNLKKRKLV